VDGPFPHVVNCDLETMKQQWEVFKAHVYNIKANWIGMTKVEMIWSL